MTEFNNKTVFVTGSASGIGQAIARRFARAGADLVIHGLNQATETAALAQELRALGRTVLVTDGDLTDHTTVQAIADKVATEIGHLDVLVNCAGGSPLKNRLEDMPLADWHRVIAINLDTQMLMCQAMLRLLRKRSEANIVNISSTVTRVGGVPGGIAYTTAKGGIDAFTRALARELAPEGIRVNAIAPGLVESAFHPFSAKEHYTAVVAHIPLGRIGEPEDLAGPVVFLASDQAAWVTGEIIEVTGGMRLSF